MNPICRGTKIFVSNTEWLPIITICPVCNGTEKVLIFPSDKSSEGLVVECQYCHFGTRDGYGAGNVVSGWEYKILVTQHTVEGVETTDRCGLISTKYLFNITSGSNQSVDAEHAMLSEAEAIKKAEELTEKAKAQRQSDLYSRQAKATSESSWSAGYYLKIIKDLKKHKREIEKQIAHAEKQVKTPA